MSIATGVHDLQLLEEALPETPQDLRVSRIVAGPRELAGTFG